MMRYLLIFIANFVISISALGAEITRPKGLSVNFLEFTDQVFLNGYPVTTTLEHAIASKQAFQFTEISNKNPLLGWHVPSSGDNTQQVAYQILVSSKKHFLATDQGDMWDSGKVLSNQSVNVAYQGKPLQSDTVYFWKIRTWDNHRHLSDYSKIQKFKMAPIISDFYAGSYPETSRYPLQKQDFPAVSISSLADTHSLMDFGATRFGRLRVKLKGYEENQEVTLHLGETVSGNTIDKNPGKNILYHRVKLSLLPGWHTYEITVPNHQSGRSDRRIQIPEYIGEVLPFRYAEIENYATNLLSRSNATQIAVNYPFNEEASHFTSSSTVLNDVWKLSKDSMKATSFLGVFVDGNRERFPREADSYINQMGYYGVENGHSIARYTHELQINYASQWTEWILQVVMIAWADYMETGDIRSISHYYDDLKAKTLHMLAREDGLISTTTGLVTMDVINAVHWHENEWRRVLESKYTDMDSPRFVDIVDWPRKGFFGGVMGEADNHDFKDINTVVNAFHYQSLYLLAKMARALNKSDDAILFDQKAKKVMDSLNKHLFDPSKKIYIDGEDSDHSSLHSNMFPLAFGMVPSERLDDVLSFIRSRGMACSPYGAYHLLDALYRSESSDYALQLLSATDERSWGHWIYDLDATLTLEAWDKKYKPNLDMNHPWGAAPAAIIPRRLMGITPIKPGYEKVRIKPQPGTLASAEIKVSTIRGAIKVGFVNEQDRRFLLHVEIPPNMTADIYLPKMNGQPTLTINKQVTPYKISDNWALVENVGSGSYQFTLMN